MEERLLVGDVVAAEIEAAESAAEVAPDSIDGRNLVAVEAVAEAVGLGAEAVERRRVANARVVRISVAPRHERAVGSLPEA